DASFDFRAHDPASGDNPTPAATCPAPPGIDLRIGKTARNTAVVPGGTVNYTLDWDNIGAGNASSVVVTDTLPADITFVSANPAPTPPVGQTLTWNLGPQVSGAHGTIVLTGTLSNSVRAGQVVVNNAGI